MTNTQEIAALLGETELFCEFGEQERVHLAGQFHEVKLQPGKVLFSRGDRSRSIYLVLKGRMRLSVVTLDGRELSLLHAERGQMFGEITAIDGGERTTDARAIGHVTLLQLDQSVLLRLLGSNADLALACCRFLCRRLRATNDTLESVALHPVEVRVARYLLSNVRDGDTSSKPYLGSMVPQTELARLIGASRPRVNYILQQLEDAGAITRVTGGTTVDVGMLEEIAQVEAGSTGRGALVQCRKGGDEGHAPSIRGTVRCDTVQQAVASA